MSTPRRLIAGNWKMFGRLADLGQITAVSEAALGFGPDVAVAICPPFGLIAPAVTAAAGRIGIGAQTLDARHDGAHTGDVSAAMVADLGARFAIVGHSERRADHAEDDAAVASKAVAAQAAGLTPILCVGESLTERQAGRAEIVVAESLTASLVGVQAEPLVIAYEPIWAIGTGLTPTSADIVAMHGVIGRLLRERYGAAGAQVRVLYGGSVKPANAAEILALDGVDGALVGGASLKAADFLAIIAASPRD